MRLAVSMPIGLIAAVTLAVTTLWIGPAFADATPTVSTVAPMGSTTVLVMTLDHDTSAAGGGSIDLGGTTVTVAPGHVAVGDAFVAIIDVPNDTDTTTEPISVDVVIDGGATPVGCTAPCEISAIGVAAVLDAIPPGEHGELVVTVDTDDVVEDIVLTVTVGEVGSESPPLQISATGPLINDEPDGSEDPDPEADPTPAASPPPDDVDDARRTAAPDAELPLTGGGTTTAAAMAFGGLALLRRRSSVADSTA